MSNNDALVLYKAAHIDMDLDNPNIAPLTISHDKLISSQSLPELNILCGQHIIGQTPRNSGQILLTPGIVNIDKASTM